MSTLTETEPTLDLGRPAERLRRRAAAVRIAFTWWGVHRTLSTQQKEDVGDTCGADARFLTAGKKIIDVRHEAFRRLTSIRSRIVSYWRALTLPYVEPGVRLIKQSDIAAFVPMLEEFREELTQAESDLNEVYESVKADARQRLGRLFNPADYPPEVVGLFGVEWDFPSVEPPSYLLRLHPEVYRLEQDRVAQRFEDAVQLAEQAFASEFAKLISHLTERLENEQTGERRVFRDSVVNNLSEFFGRFRRLNVSSSPQLDALVDQAQQLVRGISPKDLRADNGLRAQVAREMSLVETELEALIVDRPRRQIIRAVLTRDGDCHANGH